MSPSQVNSTSSAFPLTLRGFTKVRDSFSCKDGNKKQSQYKCPKKPGAVPQNTEVHARESGFFAGSRTMPQPFGLVLGATLRVVMANKREASGRVVDLFRLPHEVSGFSVP